MRGKMSREHVQDLREGRRRGVRRDTSKHEEYETGFEQMNIKV